MNQLCYGPLCFVPIGAASQKIFGFGEFLTGLALMALVWSIADERYRFRIRTAPVRLHELSFAIVGAVGGLTLLSDLWRVENWLVPSGRLLTPAVWQALLGGALLLVFLAWAWFGFMRPTRYGKLNADRFANALYRVILGGSPTSLAVVADELASSAGSIIRNATNRRVRGQETAAYEPSIVADRADDILQLIAAKRFCRVIVASSPGTAIAIFRKIADQEKYDVAVGAFAQNLVLEAIENRDSFLFQEAEGYDTGLLGYYKPLSRAMFSNYELVERVERMLDLAFCDTRSLDSEQWQAYSRVVLMVFKDYVARGRSEHSHALHRATGRIEKSVGVIHRLNGLASGVWEDDLHQRLRVAVEFINSAVKVLGQADSLPGPHRRRTRNPDDRTWYDHLAKMMFEVILAASTVREPRDTCWWIQHNAVWAEFFDFIESPGRAEQIVQFKLRRLMFDAIDEMKTFPNFRGARILGFCLNVMGLRVNLLDQARKTRALQKAVLRWTEKHFALLYAHNPAVAVAYLVDGMTYDSDRCVIVMTRPPEGLRQQASVVEFQVARPKEYDAASSGG